MSRFAQYGLLRRTIGSIVAAIALVAFFGVPSAADAGATDPSADAQRNGAAAGQRTAGTQPLVLNGGWQEFSFGEVASVGAVLRVSASQETWVRVTDAFCAGDKFLVLRNGIPLGHTSRPTASSCGVYTDSLTRAEVGDAWSSGGWLLPAGRHTITIIVSRSPFGGGAAFVRADSPAIATAVLRGSAEVPGPGDPDGGGVASTLLLKGAGEVCYTVLVSGIGEVTGGHIHAGAAGVAGPIVVDLMLRAGLHRTFSRCVPADRAVIRAIAYAPWKYYVNVHTTAFPAGAIRGQLQPPR